MPVLLEYEDLALGAVTVWPALAAVSEHRPEQDAGTVGAGDVQIFMRFRMPAARCSTQQPAAVAAGLVATGKVYLVYREFPLPIHAHSREAANYALPRRRLSLYQPVADALSATSPPGR